MSNFFLRWGHVWRCRLCSIVFWLYVHSCDWLWCACSNCKSIYDVVACLFFKEDVYMIIVDLFSSGRSKIFVIARMGKRARAKTLKVYQQWATFFNVGFDDIFEAWSAYHCNDRTNIKKCVQNIDEFSMIHPPMHKYRRLSLDDEADFVPGSGIEDLIDIEDKNLMINGWTLDSCRWRDWFALSQKGKKNTCHYQ